MKTNRPDPSRPPAPDPNRVPRAFHALRVRQVTSKKAPPEIHISAGGVVLAVLPAPLALTNEQVELLRLGHMEGATISAETIPAILADEALHGRMHAFRVAYAPKAWSEALAHWKALADAGLVNVVEGKRYINKSDEAIADALAVPVTTVQKWRAEVTRG